MSSIDNRIVNMKFDNAAFEKNARTSMSTLDRLKQALSFSGVSKGVSNINSAASRVNLAPMEGAVTGVSKSFMAMSTVAITALAAITAKAMAVGASVAKSLTIQPLMTGFNEYELKMGAIQTIMAGSGESLKVVNRYLQDLNTYSDKTIYSFKDMTSNIGKFTNAGVDLKTSVAAIQGIANVAAISGANADEASRAMYNFAQSLSQGSVKLMDWKSIELANMATKEFKTQLLDSAVAAGTLKKGAGGMYTTLKGTPVTATKGFNESLTEQWLTSEALIKTLGRYSNTNTDIGKRATAAAQDVKTFSQMLDTMKESAGSGWAETWELVFGNLKESKKLWTGVNNVLGGMISASADSRNKILEDWKKLDGRKNLIAGIGNIFKALMAVIKPIRKAFSDIFPPMTGERLAELTKKFLDFTKTLKISKDTSKDLRAIFKGIFSVFSLIGTVIGSALGVIGRLFGAFSKGSGGILEVAAGFGKFLSSLTATIKSSGIINTIFTRLGDALVVVVKFVGQLADSFRALVAGKTTPFIEEMTAKFKSLGPVLAKVRSAIQKVGDFAGKLKDKFANLFSFDSGASGVESGISTVSASMGKLSDLGDQAQTVWSGAMKVLQWLGGAIKNVWDAIVPIFSGLAGKLTEYIRGMDLQEVIALINTGVFVAMYAAIRGFFKKMGNLVDSGSEMYKSIGGILDQLTGSLKTMQTSVRVGMIFKIAASLALLAAAVKVLSTIDPKALGFALGALAGMLVGLTVAMAALEKVMSKAKGLGFVTVSVGIIALSIGVLALSAAVAIFGTMDPGTIAKGMTSVGVAIGIIVAAAYGLSKSGGAGQLVIAGGAIAIMAGALLIFAGAVKLFAGIDAGEFYSGGWKIAAALGVIAITMNMMPRGTMLSSAAGLVIVAVALNIMAKALQSMAKMTVPDIAKSLGTMALALIILAAAVNAMSGALAGAAALAVVSVGLTLLAGALVKLGGLDLKSIGKGLLAILGLFLVIGASAAILAPLTPLIMGLAVAIGLLGLAVLGIGAGLFLFATGLATLAASGAAGVAVLVGSITALAGTIPIVMTQIGNGLIAIATVIRDAAPVFAQAFAAMLLGMLTAIVAAGPQLSEKFLALLDIVIATVLAAGPKLMQAGITLVMSLIGVFVKNSQKLAEEGRRFIVAFLRGLNGESPKIATAGVKMVSTFSTSVASGGNMSKLAAAARRIIVAFLDAANREIPKIAISAARTVVTFINSVASKIGGIVKAGSNLIIKFLTGLAKEMDGLVTAGTKVVVKFINGVTKNATPVINAGVNLALKVIDGIGKRMDEIADAGTKLVGRFIKAIVGAIAARAGEAARAAISVGTAIASGAAAGIGRGIAWVTNAARNLAQRAVSAMKSILKIKSPSKVFIEIGKNVTEGFVIGIDGTADSVTKSMETLLDKLNDMSKNKVKSLAARGKEAKNLFLNGMTIEKAQLQALGAQYDELTKKIDDATSALDAAIQARDDAFRSYESQYNTLPDITEETTVPGYTSAIEAEAEKTRVFLASLQQLVAMGLDDPSYENLLKKGLGAQPFIDKLIAAGPAAVEALDAATLSLSTAAKNLGFSASQELYQAGVDSARGLLDGLNSQRENVRKEMNALARIMVTAIKKALRIKSPSQEFAEIGRYSNEGLAAGLERYSILSQNAAENVAKDALKAINDTIYGIGSGVSSNMNLSPIISPVLDLTQLRRDASAIDPMLGINALNAGVSYSQASDISAQELASEGGLARSLSQTAVKEIKFEQNNYSPKTLSPSEIYRNTRNQLALAEEALKG